jgi:hypothetical protein
VDIFGEKLLSMSYSRLREDVILRSRSAFTNLRLAI